MNSHKRHPASFRDPAGFIFEHEGKFYRQVNNAYAESYDLLLSSGLYDALVKQELLLSHTEADDVAPGTGDSYKILFPLQLPFISYPYEWSFDMLKDAALLTITINMIAIRHGMILKDATPYNIQFLNGKPIFIDSLSFEKYDTSLPWTAYRQFCEMFLYPLVLCHYTGGDCQRLLLLYLDGIPPAVAAALLPWRSRFNLHIQLHVFMQKRVASRHGMARTPGKYLFSEKKMGDIMNGLKQVTTQLRYSADNSIWSNYYNETILSNEYLENKKKLVDEFLNILRVSSVVDIGSNDGYFSLLAAGKKAQVIAVDNDSACINRLYNDCKKNDRYNIIPLHINLANPSPAIGWGGVERASFLERIDADVVLALAVIHHLAIGNNIPLSGIAALLVKMGKYVIAEFVPKEDEKVKILLAGKKDIYDDYTEASFKNKMEEHFTIERECAVPASGRTLYLLKSRHFVEKNIADN